MKKIFRNVLTGLLVSSFALTSAGTVSAQEVRKEGISKIVAFGDSASDSGEAYAVSKEILALPEVPEGAFLKPGTVYWENRYSNGKSAIEVLAEMMDKKLTNYATGGATSGYKNYTPWMDTIAYTGVLGQIDKYEKSLNGQKADPNALHFIMVGANDYSEFLDYELEGTIEGVADTVVANMAIAIRDLAELGAEKFLISNSIDLTLTPYEIREGRTDAAKAYTERVNTTLPDVLADLEKELNVDITEFDAAKVMGDIAKNPQKHGIRFVGVEAQPTYPEIKPAKTNADEYFSWDEWHFSRVTHRVIGEAMYALAKNIK